uniref:Uncharacterized protein n=1 Tax=Romanomermis culicivorax TaxID=13658 RepID=A0A915K2Y2_ROMCU
TKLYKASGVKSKSPPFSGSATVFERFVRSFFDSHFVSPTPPPPPPSMMLILVTKCEAEQRYKPAALRAPKKNHVSDSFLFKNDHSIDIFLPISVQKNATPMASPKAATKWRTTDAKLGQAPSLDGRQVTMDANFFVPKAEGSTL